MTFTILARDTLTGELGVGSFSFALAVGAGLAHHTQDGGIVAIQARGNPSWSPELLAGLAANKWSETVEQLSADPRFASSQLAALSVTGQTFVFTGPATESYAEGVSKTNLCCASNLMLAEGVSRSAARYFAAQPPGPLAERLVNTLRHADELGGDVRGRMSAFVRTFPNDGHIATVDLRVDFHPDPVTELVQLVRIHRAHELVASAVSEDGAYSDVRATTAAYQLAPESAVVAGAHLLSRLRAGDIAPDDARDMAQKVHALEPELPERLRRLEDAGRLPNGSLMMLDLTDSPSPRHGRGQGHD